MTVGALLFAYNNEKIDYVKLAAWSAANIRRHLSIPVAVVTNTQSIGSYRESFDSVIYTDTVATNSRHFSDVGTVTWYNTNRMSAYDISPWDRTLVLDVDYVVASNQLRCLLQGTQNFLCHNSAWDITGLNDFAGLNSFGLHRMPMLWATVMVFDKTPQCQMIFDMMAMVRDNWTHYRAVYQNNVASYRNDHALTIAVNTVQGHTPGGDFIPWSLASLTPEHKLQQLAPDRYRVDYVDSQNRLRWLEIANQDFHAMGKQQLGELVEHSS